MTSALRIGIIIGSTRPGRVGDQVAQWVGEHANRLGEAEYEVVDIAEANLPLLDEAIPASA
ncbi:NAD(P)H-dependent oxidoreductase, partial [Schumannella luteola]